MPHFATAALIRKRSVEKRSENHTEKTSKIHGKSDENSLRFLHPFWTPFFMDFDLIFRSFSGKKGGKTTPRRVSGISCFFALIFYDFVDFAPPGGALGEPQGPQN